MWFMTWLERLGVHRDGIRPGRYLRQLALTVLGFTLSRPGLACAESPALARLSIASAPAVAIDEHLFGVNYVWHLISAADFTAFEQAMRNIAGATIIRYPGGWAAERYDWDRNEETGAERRAVDGSGIDAGGFLATVPQASFVVPSADAIRDPSQVVRAAERAAELVRRFGARVPMWEIGNEWWLQRGAKRNAKTRADNLRFYAALVAKAAPAMKQANPRIEVYAAAEWTRPEEVQTLRQMVGPAAWAMVDGISIHPYCGSEEADRLCSLIVPRVQVIRQIAGKQKIYASEWSLGTRVSRDSFGIRNASQMVGLINILAQAGVTVAAYWPPVRAVPTIALVSNDYLQPYATGLLFGWMSRHFQGSMLPVSGDLPAAAARSSKGVSVFIPSMRSGQLRVEMSLAGTGLRVVAAAEVMAAADPDDPNRARIAFVCPLPASIHVDAHGDPVVALDLNPGTPGRGRGWEIARLTLR
jgi:hypothetical protein